MKRGKAVEGAGGRGWRERGSHGGSFVNHSRNSNETGARGEKEGEGEGGCARGRRNGAGVGRRERVVIFIR
jgi:hypothetical protein